MMLSTMREEDEDRFPDVSCLYCARSRVKRAFCVECALPVGSIVVPLSGDLGLW